MSEQNNNKLNTEPEEPLRTDFEDFDVTFKHDDSSHDDDEYLENVVLASGMAALQSERFRSKTRSDRAAQKALEELENRSLESLNGSAVAHTSAQSKEPQPQPAEQSASEDAISETPVQAETASADGGEDFTDSAQTVAAAAAVPEREEKKPFQIDERDENSDRRRHRYSSRSHSKAARRWRKFKKWQRAVIIILLILLIAILSLALTVYFMHQNGKKATMAENYGDNFQSSIFYDGVEYIYNTDITTIAFFGIDKRTFGVNDDLVKRVGQNDVNMVVAINTRTGESHVIVVPRDTLVDVNKYSLAGDYMGSDRKQLCLAYSYGDGAGTSCDNAIVSLQRILYGIPINTYVALNLDGLAPLNNALGGITVTCPNDYEDKYKKGQEITLNGDEAERFIRARQSTLTGDAERRQRQIAYVKAYVSQAAQRGMKNPALLRDIYNIGSEYTVTNLTLSRSMYFGTTILSNPSEILSFNNVNSLQGKLKLDKAGYATTVLNEDDTLKTVLDIYYTPLK